MQLTPRLVVMLATPPLMWACNAVVGRLAIESIGPLWLNALRWVVAFALLLPLGWAALGTAGRGRRYGNAGRCCPSSA
jgi:drug/metabolite transporter (DMT)-like permease